MLKDEALSRLRQAVEPLGPNALRVLVHIAERLAVGAKEYRSDFDEGRDMMREAYQEGLDLLVYLVVEQLQKQRATANHGPLQTEKGKHD